MKFGDIILVPFPFAEQTNRKIRPAVVIAETSDKFKDIVVSAISSVMPNSLSEREIIISPNSENKLRVKSIIKVDRIVTLKLEDKIADLGQLTESEKTDFRNKLIEIINAN